MLNFLDLLKHARILNSQTLILQLLHTQTTTSLIKDIVYIYCAFIKLWRYTGYFDLEPLRWKKNLTWLTVSNVLKLMWHLLNKNCILQVSSQLSVSDATGTYSDLKDTLCSKNQQCHQFFFFTICRYASVHNRTTRKKKRFHTWPLSSIYVELCRGESILQRVTFECLGRGMCWCVSLLLDASTAQGMIKKIE